MYLSCTRRVGKKLKMQHLLRNTSIFWHRNITPRAGSGTINWFCDEGIASVQTGRSIAATSYLYFKHWLGPVIKISPTPNGPGVSDINYNADNCHKDGQLHVLELNWQYSNAYMWNESLKKIQNTKSERRL